jgi:hypothetical protein
VPEPIQSVGRNIAEYDPSNDVCSEPPAAKPDATPGGDSSQPPAAHPSAVTWLVSKHPPTGAAAATQCLSEKAALLTAGGVLLRSAGALVVAAPTAVAEIPAITAFIGSAIAVGVSAATYLNCKDAEHADAKLNVDGARR